MYYFWSFGVVFKFLLIEKGYLKKTNIDKSIGSGIEIAKPWIGANFSRTSI